MLVLIVGGGGRAGGGSEEGLRSEGELLDDGLSVTRVVLVLSER